MNQHSSRATKDRERIVDVPADPGCDPENVTKGQKAAERKDLTVRMLGIINRTNDTEDCIAQILSAIKEHCQAEAVGIRIKSGEDFPYYESSGFPEQFVKAEMSLCSVDADGNYERDDNGDVCLECMCGNVICGKTDPMLPFFSPGGSFWTNSTTRLLASTPSVDMQAKTRNRCNREGYETVVLIPLKSGEEIIGLLQLNDRRENMFCTEDIEFYEELGDSIGIAVERKRAEEQLHDTNLRLMAESQSLQESNIAMKEVLSSIEAGKKESLLRIQSNIDRIVLPLVKKLQAGATDLQVGYLDLLDTNLRDITSPFVSKLEARYARLSPREVEICKMLLNGMASKEIATALNTSPGTVFNQRKTIRKKLGIATDDINLVSFLKTI